MSMKKTIPKLLTLVCLLVAVMGLSIVTAHAATVTGIVSSGNEYRYHEDKSPVSQWGPYTSNKLKYFTRNDTGETVPAYCMEPEVRSASGDLQYSSTSWSDLTWNQRYAVTLAIRKWRQNLELPCGQVKNALSEYGNELGKNFLIFNFDFMSAHRRHLHT